MFDSDLLLAFSFMALLFLRQVSILRQPNKINYAPLMVGIGAISSVVHFIIHPNSTDAILLLRESFFPLLVSLLLYIVMNILHQTQQSEQAKSQEEFAKSLISEISSLKQFMSELEERMQNSQKEDQKVQEEVRKKFQEDIKALDMIQVNQANFFKRFDEMEAWHQEVSDGFEHFTEVQLPELDNVVHKHIDILRVAEQDHYNQLKNTLSKAVDSRCDITDDIEELKKNLIGMKRVSDDIANNITKKTLEQLTGVTKAFEGQLITLKSHTESVKTSLLEGESTLSAIRQESEMIMKQMVLSSNKMDELSEKNSNLHDVYSVIKDVIKDIELIKSDYVKAQSQLSIISKEIANDKEEQIVLMQQQVQEISEKLSKKIDESLAKLHEHYHIAEEDITESVQLLAKRAQLKKGYGEFDN
jgi:DNA repair exonuclease SbcCD ATPase subunit